MEEMTPLASTPAMRGTTGAGSKGGKMTFNRWSYVNMYDVEDGTPITLRFQSEIRVSNETKSKHTM